MNYFYRVGDSFIHYEIDNYQVDLEEANDFRDEFDEQLAEFRGLTSDKAFEDYSNSHIIDEKQIFYFDFGFFIAILNHYKALFEDLLKRNLKNISVLVI